MHGIWLQLLLLLPLLLLLLSNAEPRCCVETQRPKLTRGNR